MSDNLNMSRFGRLLAILRPQGRRAERKAIAAEELEAGAALWLGRFRPQAVKRTGRKAV